MPLDDSESPPVWQPSATGIAICPGLSWAEWLEHWEPLQQIHRSINFLIGDALVYAEDNFPDQWSQALDPQYVDQHRNALWVSRSIPPADRVEGLSWSCHREVSSLDPAERNEILALAKERGWHAREVAAEKKRRKAAAAGYPSNAAPAQPRVIDHDEGEAPHDEAPSLSQGGGVEKWDKPDIAELLACRDALRSLAELPERLTRALGSLHREHKVMIADAAHAMEAVGILDATLSSVIDGLAGEQQRQLTHAHSLP